MEIKDQAPYLGSLPCYFEDKQIHKELKQQKFIHGGWKVSAEIQEREDSCEL